MVPDSLTAGVARNAAYEVALPVVDDDM